MFFFVVKIHERDTTDPVNKYVVKGYGTQLSIPKTAISIPECKKQNNEVKQTPQYFLTRRDAGGVSEQRAEHFPAASDRGEFVVRRIPRTHT